MRPSRHACLTDCADCAADRHASSLADSLRKIAQVPITTDEPVTVPDIDDIAVPALTPSKDHDSVADRPHGCTRAGRVISTLVAAPHAKDWMPAATEHARDATEADRRAKERCAQRLTGSVEILTARGADQSESPRSRCLQCSLAPRTLLTMIAPFGSATARQNLELVATWKSLLMSTRYSKMSASEKASSARADFESSVRFCRVREKARVDHAATITVSTLSCSSNYSTGATIISRGDTTTGENASSLAAGGAPSRLTAGDCLRFSA